MALNLMLKPSASLLLLSTLLLWISIHATRIEYCDNRGDYDVKVNGVKISPNPVVRGKPATFSISASTDKAIAGGSLAIDVYYFGVHIHHETHDFCEETTCPVSGNDFVISHTQSLPVFTPPGSYKLMMTLTSENGLKLTCIKFGFNIRAHSSVAES